MSAECLYWGMDIFRLSELSNGRPLTTVTYNAFKVSPNRPDRHSLIFLLPIYFPLGALARLAGNREPLLAVSLSVGKVSSPHSSL